MASSWKTAGQIADAVRAHTAKLTSATMILARQRLSAANPVDTHHSESNWVLSVGAAYTGVDGSRESVSYAAQQAGDQAVANYSADDVKKRRRIYLRDNVFYMKFLDEGSSPQAGAGWIAATLGGVGAAAHMPKGTKLETRRMLRGLAVRAIKRGRRR